MKTSKISELMNKIHRLTEDPAFPAVSKLERDLLKQHIRNLYDEVDGLGDESEIPVKKEPLEDLPVPAKRPVIRPNDNLLMKEEPPIQKTADPVMQEVIVVKEEPVAVKPAATVEIKTAPKTETIIEKQVQTISSTINESIKSTGSLNEKLKTSSAVEMHKKLASKPLKELIDLNKKFVLLNELFKGNTEAYSAAIAHIDTLGDHESAQSFISTQLVSNYAWDESKQSTRMFFKLVKMKFGVE